MKLLNHAQFQYQVYIYISIHIHAYHCTDSNVPCFHVRMGLFFWVPESRDRQTHTHPNRKMGQDGEASKTIPATGETDDRITDCSTERSGADGCLNKFLWFKESKIGWGGTPNKKLDLMGSYDF